MRSSRPTRPTRTGVSALLRPALGAALLLAIAANPGCVCSDSSISSATSTKTTSAPQASSGAPITSPFSDDFNRPAIGPDWTSSETGAYRIDDGALVVKASYNHPLWLARSIPRDARIEFDCWSTDPAGDLKVEIWGDGRSYSTDRIGAYTSTAYNFIFGGWHNQLSTLARMHEHGEDRQTRRDIRVVQGQKYHWVITRRGGHIEWTIDGAPFFTLDDPAPLEGPGHDHFAITDWEAELHFDNLKITPL